MVILGLLLMASLEVCGQATNQQGGSSFTPVAALPGTATPGVTPPVDLTTGYYGIYYPFATTLWTQPPGDHLSTFASPACNGGVPGTQQLAPGLSCGFVYDDGRYITDATTVLNNSTV